MALIQASSCTSKLLVITIFCFWINESTSDHEDLNFPPEHLPYHLRYKNESYGVSGFQNAGEFCYDKESCAKLDSKRKPCWGYEDDCKEEDRYSNPTCTTHHPVWAQTIEDQKNLFFEQGDFGYVKNIKNQMYNLCIPKEPSDSSLSCSKNLCFCRATNLYIDFRRLKPKDTNDRFREDVLKQGEVGGHCEFNKKLHHSQNAHKSALQSWYAELEHYTSLPFKPIEDDKCDIVIEKPTLLIKLDAGVSMYHHFCDFINMFASQHVNGSFSTDINIVMWDTSSLPYHDFFSDTWKAFTRHPIIRLDKFDGKRVCFKDAVFSILPRKVFGLYFNMPLVPGCMGSGLFKTFSHHVMHRLDVKHIEEEEIRITLLIRNTKYRRILNADELFRAMESVPVFKVKMVDFNHKMPFLEQLKITHNTDIFIGIHGSGLTHMLFLPDWAVVFELYNTEDPECYRDLANLRGMTYMTWENKDKLFQEDEGHHPTMGAHPKFTNYAFNVDEFMRMIYKAAELVREKKKITKKSV
ncbi:EGF domain-specific O-linked N-acetylglucosamine transferase-like [Actinia tenebrosa]|uniref:EGF domain-specific O-linked N-acetylglucosamine transferase n=1 Tax=Actinia tenebrosa TaxID=6105 RepID=A0A6P8IH81_ACTTE|nr:EGF domain-specific O-linked N-acetylglucosamine transferase-like [Actinia tenebrosa]XP_031566080.1 EGF domain-specific O-linked N-acetylglucosamine transferase-like [Actinia tenebrosa]